MNPDFTIDWVKCPMTTRAQATIFTASGQASLFLGIGCTVSLFDELPVEGDEFFHVSFLVAVL